MEADRDALFEYRCPSCQDRSPYPVRCDRCDRAMTVAGVEGHDDDATDSERWCLLVGPILGAGATWSACTALRADSARWVRDFISVPFDWAFGHANWASVLFAGPVLLFAFALLGVWFGRVAAVAKVREMRRIRRRSRGIERMGATPLVALDDLRPGRVRVRAVIVEAAPVFSNRGLACAACEALVDGGASPRPPHPLGARFTARGAGGRRVVVDARHVRVVEGFDFDEEAHVPVGAHVELVATARAVRDSSGTGAGYRDACQTYELAGTPGEPVLLRVVNAA